MKILLLPSLILSISATSTELRSSSLQTLHRLGLVQNAVGNGRHLQSCDLLSTLPTYDADSSGGLSQDEFYSFLSTSYPDSSASSASSYSELALEYKVSHKSLACYCVVLGGGEDCCVGDDAEIDLTSLENEEVSDVYGGEVCETLEWALGYDGVEVESSATTTEVPETTAAATVASLSDDVTTVAASDDVTTEAAASDDVTTEAAASDDVVEATAAPESDDVTETTAAPSDDVTEASAAPESDDVTPGYSISVRSQKSPLSSPSSS
jgi:hypothetical protein